MAHQQQVSFCNSVKQAFPHYFKERLVLDIGSLDINGNNHYLFDNCLYIGVDLLPGRNVDIASKAHELNLPDESVDVIISTECLEHDRFYILTVRNIVRMLKPGGLFLFSCASTGRPEHGTRRTTPGDAPLTHMFGEWADYYKNLDESDIRRILDIDAIFESYAFSIGTETHDLYFWGIKKGRHLHRDDYSFQINRSEYNARLDSKNIVLQTLKERIAEREIQNAQQNQTLQDQKIRLTALQRSAEVSAQRIHYLEQEISAHEAEIDQFNLAISEAREHTTHLNQTLLERDAAIQKLIASNSWSLTRPLRFLGRLCRGELQTAFATERVKIDSNRLRAIARAIYYKLPVSQKLKFRLRERMHPLTLALEQPFNIAELSRAAVEVVSGTNNQSLIKRDHGRELALAQIISDIAQFTKRYGPAINWLALPFLSSGGAEMVALNFCRALREVQAEHSVVLLVTDKNVVHPSLSVPDGVFLLVMDEYLEADHSYSCKQALLRDLLLALRPKSIHNINSEVVWHLILAEGERLKHLVTFYASIFAFQFAPDGKSKIGYAAYYLKQGMEHLSALFSDNLRFIEDATTEYQLDAMAHLRLWTIYQPSRLLQDGITNSPGAQHIFTHQTMGNKRPKVLWAGRLDTEKRVDLFLEIVQYCQAFDFHVFGQVVLDTAASLPVLSNLTYEGPFSSPLQWTRCHHFDAFLFTSKWEGLPNILIEAGSLKIPVVAPTVGGVGELITEQTGYPLPEQPSVGDYHRALLAIQIHPEDAAKRVERLYALIAQRHCWSAFVASVTAVPSYERHAPKNETVDLQSATAVNGTTCCDPCVSVIIPCYNQAHYLYECVSALLAACHTSMEIIIIDDGSTAKKTDQYLACVVQLAPSVIQVHHQENQGLSAARNKGLEIAKGRYIQFLDADDMLTPNKIDTQVAQLAANPELDVSICNFLLCDETRNVYSKPDEAIARFDLTLEDFLYRWERGFSVPIHCGLFKRSLLAEVRFDTHARAKEDWLFWTGLAISGVRMAYVHGHWAIYRQHDKSMRQSYVNMGRAWLQSGLKINTLMAGRDPLFFESVLSWFEQCYRGNPAYKAEISAMQQSSNGLAALDPFPSATLQAKQSKADSASDTDTTPINPERILSALTGVCTLSQAPLVSVIIPIYGHYAYLENCLLSIAEQGDAALEIICIDDASPDPRIAQLMQALSGKFNGLKIISNTQNCGISMAQNRAVAAATGNYLAFLDCDDALQPDAIPMVIQEIERHPDADYLFSDRLDVDEDDFIIRVARYGGYEKLSFNSQENIRTDLLDGMVASHLKVIRRSTYLQVGGCDPRFSGVQDWDLALKIADSGKLHYIAKTLYRHRVHQHSVTKGDVVAQFRKTNEVRRQYCERWLRSANRLEMQRTQKPIGITGMPVPLATLKQYWEQGFICVVDACGIPSVAQINWLREFNSYFDAIIWDHPEVPASLAGYLWNPMLCERRNIRLSSSSTVSDIAQSIQR